MRIFRRKKKRPIERFLGKVKIDEISGRVGEKVLERLILIILTVILKRSYTDSYRI